MDWSQVTSEILKGLIAAAVPVLIALAGMAFSWIREYAKAHIKNATLQRVTDEAFVVVQAVGQAIGDDLKAAAKDGKLSEDEKAMLKAKALNALKERLRDIPKSILPDLETRLSDAIEYAVGASKKVIGPVSQ